MKYQRHSRAVEFRLQQLAVAWEEYLEEKARARAEGRPHSVTMTSVALRHGMSPNQLAQYHANHHYSREKSTVSICSRQPKPKHDKNPEITHR